MSSINPLIVALGGAVLGSLLTIFTGLAQEVVIGYLALARTRRHVMDMLSAEAARRPIISKKQVRPGIWDVTAVHHSAAPATREALVLYLEAAKKSSFRLQSDKRAVAALAPRLQFATVEVGKVTFLAICKLISPDLSAPSIENYAALVEDSVRASATSLPAESVEEMSKRARVSLSRDIEEILQAFPGRRQHKEEPAALGTPWIYKLPEFSALPVSRSDLPTEEEHADNRQSSSDNDHNASRLTDTGCDEKDEGKGRTSE